MRTLFLVTVLAAGSASAATFRSGERIVVPQGEVVDDDLYAFGQSILIEGEVRGDVVAFGAEVRVPGHVRGDLISASREMRLEGRVDGSIRSAGGELTLAGQVGKDAVIAGGTADLAQGATVAGDVAVAGGKARLLGSVGRDVRAASEELVIDGAVRGSVQAQAERLTIGDRASLNGTLKYSSPREAPIPAGARVGNVDWQPVEGQAPGPVRFALGWLRLSVGFLALGLLALLVAPKLTRSAPATLRARPWRSLGIGTVALVAAPLAGAALFGLGLLLGGWWLAILFFAALLIAVSLSFPTVGLLVGDLLVGRRVHVRLAAALAIGVVLLALVIKVPFIGALAVLAAMLFGLGALLLAAWRLRQAPSPAPI